MTTRPTIHSYKNLEVWQVAMSVAVACYRETKRFPQDELCGMTSQIRRGATAIPATIAEGYGRESTGSYVQLPRIAQGSLKELETLILLAGRVDLMTNDPAMAPLSECDRVGRMPRNLIRSLEAKD